MEFPSCCRHPTQIPLQTRYLRKSQGSRQGAHEDLRLLIYFRLHWVFLAARGLPPAAGSWGYCRAAGHGFPTGAALSLGAEALGCAGSGVAPRLQCSAARRIFLDLGSNPHPLRWQADFNPWIAREGLPSLVLMVDESTWSIYVFQVSICHHVNREMCSLSSKEQRTAAVHRSQWLTPSFHFMNVFLPVIWRQTDDPDPENKVLRYGIQSSAGNESHTFPYTEDPGM